MRRVFIAIVWAAALALGLLSDVRAEEKLPVVILGYYPSWANQLPPSKINFGLFTHVVHAFAELHGGRVRSSGNLPSAELTRLAHGAGVKVLLGLGGADSGPEFSKVVQKPERAAAFVAAVAKLVAENGYDGVDVDWEFPGEADVDKVVSFVTDLRTALRRDNPHALVTMPVPWAEHDGRYFDAKRLAPLLDLVQVMTYEAHGPWRDDPQTYSRSGFNAPLHETATEKVDGQELSFQKGVDYWRGRGFTDAQLVVGVPCFGHAFAVAHWGDVPTKLPPQTDMDYRAIPALLKAGWQRHWDEQAAVPWLQSPPGAPQQLISYDDPQSAALKGKWAREAGVRGIFFWEISQDEVEGRNVLVEAAREGFGVK